MHKEWCDKLTLNLLQWLQGGLLPFSSLFWFTLVLLLTLKLVLFSTIELFDKVDIKLMNIIKHLEAEELVFNSNTN